MCICEFLFRFRRSMMVQNDETPLKSEELEIYDVEVNDGCSSKKDNESIECSKNSNSPIMETAYGDVVFVDVNDPEFGLDSEFIIDDNTSNLIEEIIIEDSGSDIIVIDDNEPGLKTDVKENVHISFEISNENSSGHQKWKGKGLFGCYKDNEGFSKDISTVSEEPQDQRQKLENKKKINGIKTNDIKIESNHSYTSNTASKPGLQNENKVIKPMETSEHTNFLKIMDTFSLKVKDDNVYAERKKRGRPPKLLLETNETSSNNEIPIQNQDTVPLNENTSKVQLDNDTIIIKKRGRLPTLYTGANFDQNLKNHNLQLQHQINRKRGRPPKVYTEINNSDIVVQNQNTLPLGEEIQKELLIVKKRGRPPKFLTSSKCSTNSDETLYHSHNFVSLKENNNNIQPCQEPKKSGKPWNIYPSVNIGGNCDARKNSNLSKKDNMIHMQESNIKNNKTSRKTNQFITSCCNDEIKHQNICYSKDGDNRISVPQETSIIGISRETSSESRASGNDIVPQILKNLLVKEKSSLPQQTSGKPYENLPRIDTDNKNILQRSKNISDSVNVNIHTPQFVKRKVGRPWKYPKETGTIYNPEVVHKDEKQIDNLLDSRLVKDSHKEVMLPITDNLTVSDVHEKAHSKSKPKLIMKVSRSWKVDTATDKNILRNQVNNNNEPQEMIRKDNEKKDILKDSKRAKKHNDRVFDSQKVQFLDSANNVSMKRGPGRPRKHTETVKPTGESNSNKKFENRLTNHKSKWPRQSKTNQHINKSRRKYDKHKILFWKTRKTYQDNFKHYSFPNFEANIEVVENQQTLKLNKPADEKLSNVQTKLKRKYEKRQMLFWKTRKTYQEESDNVSDLESSNKNETVGNQRILKSNELTDVKLSTDRKMLKRKYEKSKMIFWKTRKTYKTNSDLLHRKDIVNEKPFNSETNYNRDEHSEMRTTGQYKVLSDTKNNKIGKQDKNHENYNPSQEIKSYKQNLPECQALTASSLEDNLKVQPTKRRSGPKRVRDSSTVQSNTNVLIISNERKKPREMRRDINFSNFIDLDPDLKLKFPKFHEVAIPLIQEIINNNSSLLELSENITDSIKSSNSLSLPKSVSPCFGSVNELTLQNINSANNKILNHLEPTNCEILNVEIKCLNRNKNDIENNVAKVSQVQTPSLSNAYNQELQNTCSNIVTSSEPILKTACLAKEPSRSIVDDVNNHNKHCISNENDISTEHVQKPFENIIQPQLEVDYLNTSVPLTRPLKSSIHSSLLEPTYENYTTERDVLNNKLINPNFTPTITSYNQLEAEIITGDDDTSAFVDCNVQHSQNQPNFPIIPDGYKFNTLNNYMPQVTTMNSINNFHSNYSSNKTIVERHSAFYEQVQNPSLYTLNQNNSTTSYHNPVRISKELYQTNVSTVSMPTQNKHPSVSLELMFNNQSQKRTPPTLTGMDKELYDKLDVCFNEAIELQIRDIACLIFKMLANKMSIRNLEFSMKTDTRNVHRFVEAISAEKKKSQLIGMRFTILFDTIIKSNPAFETSDLIYVLFYKIMETLVKKDQAMPFIFIIRFYIGQMLRHNNYTNTNVLEVLLSSETEFKFCYRTIQKRLEYYKQYNHNNFLTSESICSSVDNLLKTVEQSSFALVPNLTQLSQNSTVSEQDLPSNKSTSAQKTLEQSYQNISTNEYLQHMNIENQTKMRDINEPIHSYHISHSIFPPCTNSAVPNINVNISVNNPFTNTRNDYVETLNKPQILSKSSENNNTGKKQNIYFGNFAEHLDNTNLDKSQKRNDKGVFETLRAAATNLPEEMNNKKLY